jgi:hypothetical protein
MYFSSFSSKFRIIWSFMLALTLTGTVAAEAYLLRGSEKEELNIIDEESKSENELKEENSGRKHSENKYEGANSGDDNLGSSSEFNSGISTHAVFFPLDYSHAYYPHLNFSALPTLENAKVIHFKLFIKYHSLVFYA